MNETTVIVAFICLGLAALWWGWWLLFRSGPREAERLEALRRSEVRQDHEP